MLKNFKRTSINGLLSITLKFHAHSHVSHFPVETRECIDVVSMTDTKGEDILQHYEQVFEKIGYPVAFLQDGGGNLKSAVHLLNEKRVKQQLAPIPIISDVGHYSAQILKGAFHKENYMQELLAQATQVNLKVRLTRYAFLMAPKARTAGRYMGYMKKMLRWLYTLKRFTQGARHPIEGSLQEFILSIFPNLHKTLETLQAF